jgi:nitrite reductase/ring-hydroxylating ferredoxin subunit
MSDFIAVASLDQLPPGKCRTVWAGNHLVAIYNVDGTVYATGDSCLHEGHSLGNGRLQGNIVTCRAHGWRYDVTSGHLTLDRERGVASYPVKIEDGRILVAVE